MKEKILKCLREAEDYVSGQELCQMFDVSVPFVSQKGISPDRNCVKNLACQEQPSGK